MNLLVCDEKEIKYYKLPDNVESYFIVNYVNEFEQINETLTLIADENKNWTISSDTNISITHNGQKESVSILANYDMFDIHFNFINKSIKIYTMPTYEKYTEYELTNVASVTIGSDRSSTIFFDSVNLLLKHANIYVENNEYYIKQEDENAEIYVNKRRVKQKKLIFGDTLFINGLKIIWLGNHLKINQPNNKVTINGLTPNAGVERDATVYTPTTESEKMVNLYSEKDMFFHTPKISSVIEPKEIEIESPPEKDHSLKIPAILTMGSTMVIGFTSALTLITTINDYKKGGVDKTSFIIQMVVCIAMLISSTLIPFLTELWQKAYERRLEKRRLKTYHAYLDGKKKEIDEIIKDQMSILSQNHLTLDEIQKQIVRRGYNFWSREIVDLDFLKVRLGIGDLPAQLEVSSPTERYSMFDDELRDEVLKMQDVEKKLKNVPVTISILDNIITPFIINDDLMDRYISSIMLQLAFYYSSLDLKLVIFTNEENKYRWENFKYSSYVWNKDRSIRFFSTNEKEMVQISMFLEQEYNRRTEEITGTQDDTYKSSTFYKKFDEYFLIITDDFKYVKDLSFIQKIIDSDMKIGFSIMVFSENMKNLPSRIKKFIVVEPGASGLYSRSLSNEPTYQIKFQEEMLQNSDISSYIDIISNVPVDTTDKAATIPTQLNFMELFNVGMVEQFNVLSTWKTNDPTTSLNAQIGLQANNKQIGLDLHEKYHGPHGLVAGTTGSGKSEFIITYILSMAVNYHPYEVQFVLIDYKGGGLAGAFENKETGVKLPHLIGTITNLDTSEMNRTLVSINSEMKRRQRKFNEVRDALSEGTIDIYKYQRFYREGKVKEPISHLFIISDEFAELKDQQPEFLDELVSTARIGRSLGVHLILATQKPSGVVNDQIWSNSRFKVCLKVQTIEDSMEMLKRPEAAKIKGSGRFYLQVGEDEIFEQGQSAWAGDKYIPSEKVMAKINDSLDFIQNDGTIIKSINDEVKQEDIEDHGEQLPNVVKYLSDVAKSINLEENYLWLPALEENIYLVDLIKKYSFKGTPYKLDAIIGEYDAPARQEQGIYPIDITTSSTVIIGASGSGKENIVTTLIYSICALHTIDEVNFYILDFGSEVLGVLKRLPHVGDIMNADVPDKIVSYLEFLHKEMIRRKSLFADYSGSYENYIKSSNSKLPVIVTIVNSYENFMEVGEDYDNYLNHIIREGRKYGIVFIYTAVSTGSMRASMLEYFDNKMLLQVGDPFDYQYILEAPRGMVPKKAYSRGLTRFNDEAVEFQGAYVTNVEAINETIKKAGKSLSDYYKRRAPEIKVMPRNITLTDMIKKSKTLDHLVIGYVQETVEESVINLLEEKVKIITGENILTDNWLLCNVVDLIDSIKNIKINILDMASCVDFEGNAVYYSSDFSEPFNEILSDDSEEPVVNIILGLASATILDENEMELLSEIMNKIKDFKNQYFVIMDNSKALEELIEVPWFENLNAQNIYWVGTGIDNQKLISIDNIDDDDIYNTSSYQVYEIHENSYKRIRAMGSVNEDGDDY